VWASREKHERTVTWGGGILGIRLIHHATQRLIILSEFVGCGVGIRAQQACESAWAPGETCAGAAGKPSARVRVRGLLPW
jgi:hypothetical protein